MSKEDGKNPSREVGSSNGEIMLALGYSERDNLKALAVIAKILPHFSQADPVIVGGLARRHHLLRRGKTFPERPFNDLDIMVDDESKVKPSILNDFLITHYHPAGKRSFYTGLIDRQTNVTVDLFDSRHAPIDPETVLVGGVKLKVRGIEDQLTHHIYDLLRFMDGQTASPKQFDSITQLTEIANLSKAEEIWTLKYAERFPFSLQTGVQMIEEERARHPERIFEHPERKSEAYACPECVHSPNFPLSPAEEIIRRLGYIE